MPLVTVIIPSFNHSKYVAKTIDSVLSQAYKNIELIVIDDGSTDGSVDLLKSLQKSHQFELIPKSNGGICSTLNKGIQRAKGTYITFIASDDMMTPNRVAQQVSLLESTPEIDVVAGGVTIIDEEDHVLGSKIPRRRGIIGFPQLLKRNPILAPTAMFRGTVFSDVGLYDETVLIEDIYMWLKLAKRQKKIFNTSHVWALYRVGKVNLERKFKWYHKGYKQVLSTYLPDPVVRKALRRYDFIYLTKMTFLNGKQALLQENEILSKLSFSLKSILMMISVTPKSFRHFILYQLMSKY